MDLLSMSEWQTDFLKQPLFNYLNHWLDKYSINLPKQWPNLETYNHWLSQIKTQRKIDIVNAQQKNIEFVSQTMTAPNFSDGYEQRIYLNGEVQTRLNNWHDFFNALIWLRFPKIKQLLNHWQYQEAYQQRLLGQAKQRTTVQNQLAHFDECGLIILSKSKELLALIRQHQWHELFWQRRKELIETMYFEIFGHALYEKALAPYIGFTGKALLIHTDNFADPEYQALKTLEQHLNDQNNNKIELAPVPLLGIPGWYPQQNNTESFYFNEYYFRPLTN